MGGAIEMEADGDTPLGRSARFVRVTVAVTGGSIRLPDATQLKPGGTQFLIQNLDDTREFDVVDSESGDVIVTILVGQRAKFHLLDNSTPDGIWVSDLRTSGPSGTIPKRYGAIVGGVINDTNVSRLDHATDTFSAGTSSPNPRLDGSSFSISDGLFMGGHFPIAAGSSRLDVYRNDTWLSKAPSPINLALAGSGSAFGRGYFISGFDLTQVMRYDPTTNSWLTMREIGYNRRSPACASIRNKIYLICGRPLETPSVVYSPLVDSFHNLQPYVGVNRFRMSGFNILETMIVCGGKEGDGTVRDLVEKLDATTETWSAGPVLPMGARYGGAAFAANYRGYFGVGRDSSEVEQADVATYRGTAWSTIGSVITKAHRVENSAQSTS